MLLVTTNGTFDLLHRGHVEILQQAKRMGDKLVVLINSDASVKRNKGEERPIMNQEDRKFMLESLSCVDEVHIFDEDTPLEVLKSLQPDIHVKGGSFLPERIEEEKALIESWGGTHVCLPLKEGYSTTNIIKKIRKEKE